MLSGLRLFAPLSSTLPPLLSIDSDNLQHLFLVEFFEARRRDDLLMVLLGKEETCLLESFAVEIRCVFEDLAHRVYTDVLSEDVFTLSFDRLDVITVSKL